MSEFKIGDRIKRIIPCSWAEHGDEGVVLGVNNSGSLKVEMDNGHRSPNCSSKRVCLVTPRNKSETKGDDMPYNIKIENQTLVNGVVVSKAMTDDELFSVIADGEAEIERLDGIKNKPKALEARIAELKDGIQGVVDIVDSRS